MHYENDLQTFKFNFHFIDRVESPHVMRCVWLSQCTIHEHDCQIVLVL